MKYNILTEISEKMGSDFKIDLAETVLESLKSENINFKPGCIDKENANTYNISVNVENYEKINDGKLYITGHENDISMFFYEKKETEESNAQEFLHELHISNGSGEIKISFKAMTADGYYHGDNTNYDFYDNEACKTCLSLTKDISNNKMRLVGIEPDESEILLASSVDELVSIYAEAVLNPKEIFENNLKQGKSL